MLARVSRIMEQLVHAWDVLATMTPTEYSALRPYLGSSSGFQSYQYRELEFILGNKKAVMVKPHAHRPELHERVLAGAAGAVAVRRGDPAAGAQGLCHRCRSTSSATGRSRAQFSESLRRPGSQVYRKPESHWDLYQLAEEFIDLEDAFRQWRFRHVTTVERIIGFKPGTGGTAGVAYLRKMLDVVLFPELWKVRTDL